MSGQASAGGGRWIGIRRVFMAEVRRHFKVAPVSLVLATFVFPFLTVVMFYYLPGLEISGRIHVQRGVISEEGLGGAGSGPEAGRAARASIDAFLKELQVQSYYRLDTVPDAAAAWEAGQADLAIVLHREAPVGASGAAPPAGSVSTEPGPGGAASAGGPPAPLPVRIEVFRKHDFLSDLFMDHLEKTRRNFVLPRSAVQKALEPEVAAVAGAVRAQKNGLTERTPFVLLGFAWFFLTVGTVEAFVTEKERRTLELLLSAVDRETLAWGKIAFVVAQASGPQIACATAFLLLGFSPWVLSVTLLSLVTLVPVAVAAFWYFRDLDNTLAAGWRNGLLFVLGFPFVILTDSVIGTYSPFYHLAKALEGPPPPLFYGACLALAVVLAGLAVRGLPAVARRWTP